MKMGHTMQTVGGGGDSSGTTIYRHQQTLSVFFYNNIINSNNDSIIKAAAVTSACFEVEAISVVFRCAHPKHRLLLSFSFSSSSLSPFS